MKTLSRILLALFAIAPGIAFSQATYPGSTIHAEDAAHVSADKGLECLAVRKDTAAATCGTDGDYCGLIVDADGKLWVHSSPGSGASDSGKAEDSAHTSADVGNMCLGVRAAAPTDRSAGGTDGDYEPFALDALGKIWVSGSYVEDAAETAGGSLSMAGAVVRTTKGGSTATAGDNATVNVNGDGGLWLAADVIEDVAETVAAPLVGVGTVRRDTKASSAGTAGDNATLNTDANGGLWLAADVLEDAAETAGAPLVGVGAVARSTVAGSTATDNDNATLNVSTLGALYVQTTGAGTLTCAQVDVAATGTAVQGATTTCKYVLVSCEASNTSNCFVRGSAGNGVTGGMEVAKSTSPTRFEVNNTNLLWFDAGTNGDDVAWCCVN